MTERAFAWSLAVSVGVHVGLAATMAIVGPGAATPASAPIAVELVAAAATPAPPPPVEKPRTVRREALPRAIEPPRLAGPTVVEPPRDVTPAHDVPPDAAPVADAPAASATDSAPEPGPPLAQPVVTGHSAGVGEDATRAGGAGVAAGSGGDVPVAMSFGNGGASRGSGDRAGVANAAPRGRGPGEAFSFARPRGGYQDKPVYPESARRLGAQGVTLLTFEVRADGRVGDIRVARSAGHPDLDEAAIEAVSRWRFEPARRGREPVAVWVTLPVRFELR